MTFFLFKSPYKRTPRGILKYFFEKLHVCVQLFAFSGVLVKGVCARTHNSGRAGIEFTKSANKKSRAK